MFLLNLEKQLLKRRVDGEGIFLLYPTLFFYSYFYYSLIVFFINF